MTLYYSITHLRVNIITNSDRVIFRHKDSTFSLHNSLVKQDKRSNQFFDQIVKLLQQQTAESRPASFYIILSNLNI